MISIGNDIVSLDHPNRGRALDERFYSKFLSRTELGLFPPGNNSSLPLDAFIWLAWSVKEAAFKYLKRIIPDLIFSPVRFILEDFLDLGNYGISGSKPDYGLFRDAPGTLFGGRVGFDSHTLHFKSAVFKGWVHSVVLGDENFKRVVERVRRIDNPSYDDQAKAVRIFSLESLGRIFPNSDLQIEKHPYGYPRVRQKDGKILPVPVSFSHDGSFVAYCFRVG